MIKRSKLVYVLGSAIIGIVSIIFIFAGLILSGVIDASSSKIIVVSSSRQAIYDGQILTCDEWKITEGSLKEGHTAKVVFTGNQTNVGESENTFDLSIYDKNGADVSADYEIVCKTGVLSVSPRPITLQAGTAAKEYDGTPLRENSFEILSGELVETHLISADVLGEITDAGTSENLLKTTIRDAEGTDVTANYAITELSGTLTVTPRKLILESGSDSKIYDTTPLVKEDYEVLQGELASGQKIVPDYLSSLTDVGKIDNLFNVEIFTETDTKVTNNYDITYEYGELEVYTYEIKVETGSMDKPYDGEILTYSNWKITEGQVFSGHTLEVTCTGVAGDVVGKPIGFVETVPNTANYSVYDADGNDITFNYDVDITEGTLSIEKRKINIDTWGENMDPDKAVKTYDGSSFDKALYHQFKVTDIESNGSMLPAGDFVQVEKYMLDDMLDTFVNATQEGELNEIQYKIFNINNEDVTECYTVNVNAGRLIIVPVRVAITSESETGISYSGTPLKLNSWSYQCYDKYNQLVDISALGHYIEGECTGSQTTVGESENTVDWWVCDYATYREVSPEIAANYVLDEDNSSYGKLEVLPKTITIKTYGVSRAYNGQALENPGYDHTNLPELCAGHSFAYVRCNAWIGPTSIQKQINKPDFKIVDGSGNDVTSNYKLDEGEGVFGILEVYKIQVVVKADDRSKDYDGLPFIQETYTVSTQENGGVILDGHSFDSATFESHCTWEPGDNRIAPGKYDNIVSCYSSYLRIVDANGYNQSRYYSITIKKGTLEIIPREITIQTSSATKVYDGKPLYGNTSLTYNYVKDNKLLVGDTLSEIILRGDSQTDAGSCENTALGAVIRNANGVDVTRYYNISYEYGILRVNPMPITIESGSASKNYDGNALTNNVWSCTGRQPLAEHTINVFITGSRTEVGESPNTISSVYIYETTTSRDVTDNYKIRLVEGSLIVKGAPSYSSLSTNNGGSGLADTNTDRMKVAARVKSDVSGLVYLKQKSEGNYVGNGWSAATEYTAERINGKYSMDYLSGLALEADGIQPARLQIELVDSGATYMLPYYMQQGEFVYNIQTSDVRYSGSADFKYSMYYYPYSYQEEGFMPKIPTAYAAYEDNYSNFVNAHYTSLPTATEAYLKQIVSAKKWTSSTVGIVSKIARYVQGAATYNLNYDRALDSSSDVIIDFLENKEGVCRHFASAATALYRAVGIPARYTVGFVVNAEAGQYVDVTYAQAHAWVEVYLKNTGWVQVEVTGSNSGVLGDVDESKSLQIYPMDQEVKGNSGTLLNATNAITGNNNFLELIAKGYTYYVEVEGAQAGVGRGSSIITKFVLYDPDGEDVTDEYSIEKFTGDLHVYSYELNATSISAEQEYNGNALTAENSPSISGLQSGHRAIVSFTGTQTDVGVSANAFTLTVEDRYGNDVTDQYKINYSYGTLKITKAKITVKTGSATAVCDKTSSGRLTCYSAEIIGDLGANIETITFDRGAYLDLNRTGTCTNIATLTIEDEQGNDITSNYDITYDYGTLTVKGS